MPFPPVSGLEHEHDGWNLGSNLGPGGGRQSRKRERSWVPDDWEAATPLVGCLPPVSLHKRTKPLFELSLF